MRTRQDVIETATEILRESGPSALTSVAVAKRLGVNQSAIYRHIRDMNELTTIASHAVVGELAAVLLAAAAAPETTWGDGSHLTAFADRLVDLAGEHQHAFDTIERWRYDVSELGEGIRALLGIGTTMVATEFEREWRENFQCDTPFDDVTSAALVVHASLIVDDLVAVARRVRTAGPPQRQLAVHLASLRMFAAWCGYVLEANTAVGVPIPELGSANLSSPKLATT